MKIIYAILLAISFSASAETTYLYTEVSQPGETMDAFVLRSAYKLSKETDRLNAEVCGVIQHNGESVTMVVNTDRLLTGCTIKSGDFISVHTHPRMATNQFSASDLETEGYLIHGRAVYHQDGVGSERLVGMASKPRNIQN